MKKPRTVTEYRVMSLRTGNSVSEKRYRSLKSAAEERERGPEDYACCPGGARNECACGGMTLREQTAEVRKDLPPVEWVRVEQRQILSFPWEPCGDGSGVQA